ncbi:MAG: putative quinol monooxygenase [Pseudomonadota bacterium]
MFAVTVTFKIHLDQMDDFLPLMQANAQASVQDEPGCHQFDICTDPKSPGTVFLYELYDDEAAFEAHQTMPHYAAFGEAAGDMIAEKTVATFSQVRQ